MLSRQFLRIPRRSFTTAVTSSNDKMTHNEIGSVHLDAVSEPYGVASGAPEQFVHRSVRILHPSRSATQQSLRTNKWFMEFETTNKWLNPLMGWTSSNDTAHQVRLSFSSRESAIAYAEKQGFRWTELKDQLPKRIKKSYSDNFKWKGFPKEEQAHNPPSAKQA